MFGGTQAMVSRYGGLARCQQLGSIAQADAEARYMMGVDSGLGRVAVRTPTTEQQMQNDVDEWLKDWEDEV